MKIIETSWREFRNTVLEHIEGRLGPRLCRGQADADWCLRTSFHRKNAGKLNFQAFFNVYIPYLADLISTLEKRPIDVSKPVVNGAFLAYAQHHGLPTPLLDWSYSPYTAAYYAFAEIEDVMPQSNKVAIYIFDYVEWRNTYHQINDINHTFAHVSVLPAQTMGNHRQIFQQGTYLFTNVDDVEAHIKLHENQSKKNFLKKYVFNVREKPNVMKELDTMNINAFSLYGGTEGMFRHFKESVFLADTIGETPEERVQKFLEQIKGTAEESQNLKAQAEKTSTTKDSQIEKE